MTEYLNIEQRFLEKQKTPFYIVSRKEGIVLGCVVWRNTWRNFVWNQAPDVDMTRGCLDEMWNKIDVFEKQRKGI
jgi:hypothetical protein